MHAAPCPPSGQARLFMFFRLSPDPIPTTTSPLSGAERATGKGATRSLPRVGGTRDHSTLRTTASGYHYFCIFLMDRLSMRKYRKTTPKILARGTMQDMRNAHTVPQHTSAWRQASFFRQMRLGLHAPILRASQPLAEHEPCAPLLDRSTANRTPSRQAERQVLPKNLRALQLILLRMTTQTM